MNPADAQRLQEVYRRESRSLLQYAREASPYTAGVDKHLLAATLRIADEDLAAIQAFESVLDANRVPLPQIGSFPVGFTDLNFVAIRHMLTKLIAEQKRDVAKLEADAGSLIDVPARAAVHRMVEMHRKHAAELEALAIGDRR